ncbi:MAG: hypothetical protein ACOZJZ_06840 [Pseudomonadota bacterium]
MADDPMGLHDAREAAERAELSRPDEGADPLLGALGYEAADPALQARLWGEPAWEPRA